jgi:hypothetical protein
MCILEIERTLNNVVACLALPGSYPPAPPPSRSKIRAERGNAFSLNFSSTTTRTLATIYSIFFITVRPAA